MGAWFIGPYPRDMSSAAAEVTDPASTILLVDDDGDFRAAFAETLCCEGYGVVEASSGKAALAALDDLDRGRKQGPDVLVLDLMMPGMSGIELLQCLRRSPRWARLPVVIVTGVNDPMLSVRLDLPIAFKPDVETLLTAVRRELVNHQALRSGKFEVRRSPRDADEHDREAVKPPSPTSASSPPTLTAIRIQRRER
jgi:CheY-like chemotaxis protein